MEWHEPLSLSGLETTPGLHVVDTNTVGYPSDCSVRFMSQYAFTMTRRGSFFSDPAQVAGYLEDPQNIWLPSPPFKFIIPSAESPTFNKPSGKTSNVANTGKFTIKRGKRKGFQIDLNHSTRRKSSVVKVIPSNSAPSKYSKVPHPLFELSSVALS